MVLIDKNPVGAWMYELQAPATLNQAAPVQNTYYDVLATTARVFVWAFSVNIDNWRAAERIASSGPRAIADCTGFPGKGC